MIGLYDRYTSRGEGTTPRARVARIRGAELCAQGRTAEAEAELERALQANDIPPPPRG